MADDRHVHGGDRTFSTEKPHLAVKWPTRLATAISTTTGDYAWYLLERPTNLHSASTEVRSLGAYLQSRSVVCDRREHRRVCSNHDRLHLALSR